MILYHATHPEFLKPPGGTILTEGIKPSVPGVGKQPLGLLPHGVVWLSKVESTAAWGEFAWAICSIKLSIPSHDKKLMKWRRWLAQHMPDVIENADKIPRYQEALDTTFVYFGTVPTSYFKEIIFDGMTEAEAQGFMSEENRSEAYRMQAAS